MYDYSKYENATPKQLAYALSLAEKRAEKLNLQLKENEEFFKFLQKKLKNSINAKKAKKEEQRRYELDEPTKETIRALKNAKSLPQYVSHEQLVQELQAEINANA